MGALPLISVPLVHGVPPCLASRLNKDCLSSPRVVVLRQALALHSFGEWLKRSLCLETSSLIAAAPGVLDYPNILPPEPCKAQSYVPCLDLNLFLKQNLILLIVVAILDLYVSD